MEFINNKPKRKKPNFESLSDDSDWFGSNADWGDLTESVKKRSRQDIEDAKLQRPQKTLTDTDKVQKTGNQNKQVDINIKLSVPKMPINRLKSRISGIYHNKFFKIAVILIVITIIGLLVFQFMNKKEAKKDTASTNGAKPAEVSHDPPFEITEPEGRAIKKDNITYDPQKNFAKYDDEVDGVKLTVSQQPIPATFTGDVDANVKKVSEGFNAKEILSDKDPLAYIGQDVSGRQTIILVKDKLLIFILTAREVDKKSLTVYVQNLK